MIKVSVPTGGLWLALLLMLNSWAFGQEDWKKRVEDLERKYQKLVTQKKGDNKKSPKEFPSGTERFSLAGYGEIHANFAEGSGKDSFDFHRIVLDLEYAFNDWITFKSELEIEHPFVSSGSGGELLLEQLFLEFQVHRALGFRVGRVLTPLGIINQRHEPPGFNGVERPHFASVIIPSTWSSDGVGIFGRPCSWFSYELYLVAGLDGSKFNSTSGIRGGRLKERPTLHEPALTSRFEFSPNLFSQMTLRFGLSMYYGGLANGNNGGTSAIEGSLQIYSADMVCSFWRIDLRGVLAYEFIDGARQIGNGTASQIYGGYIEMGVRVMPQSWKKGLFQKSELIIFGRHEHLDLQKRMPPSIGRNGAGQLKIWAIGVTFLFQANLALKADVQFWDDKTNADLPILFNLGFGWQF